LNENASRQELEEFEKWLLLSEQIQSEFSVFKKNWDSAA